MQTTPVIFVVIAVLLAPFVYGITSLPDVCAAPKFPTNLSCKEYHDPRDGKDKKTCCITMYENSKWTTACQTCAKNSQDGRYSDCEGFKQYMTIDPDIGILRDLGLLKLDVFNETSVLKNLSDSKVSSFDLFNLDSANDTKVLKKP